jgi:hypothetical protein
VQDAGSDNYIATIDTVKKTSSVVKVAYVPYAFVLFSPSNEEEEPKYYYKGNNISR